MRLVRSKILALALALCLVLGLTSVASAVVLPAPGLYVGDQYVPFDASGEALLIVGDSRFSASFAFDPDPTIIWSVDVTNLTGAPVDIIAISPLFSTPGFPGGIILHADSGTSLTPGVDGSATIDPLNVPPFPFIDKIATNYTLDTFDGFFINAWGTGDAFAATGNTDTEDYVFDGFGPNGPNNFFLELVAFTLSDGDSTGLSGKCSFVPVPPSVLLLGSGLLSLGVLGWRRKLS
jgi:hypothetical protein